MYRRARGREDKVLRDRLERPHSTVVDRTENSNGAAWLEIPVGLNLDLIAAPGGASKLRESASPAPANEVAVSATTGAIQMLPKQGRRFPVVHATRMSNDLALSRQPCAIASAPWFCGLCDSPAAAPS